MPLKNVPLSFNNPQYLHLQRNVFLRISTLICFAVNCSNTISKTKPIRGATFIVKNRNSDKICKVIFSGMHQIAEILTDAKLVLSSIYL